MPHPYLYLTRRLRGISEIQPSQSKNVYKGQGGAEGWYLCGPLALKSARNSAPFTATAGAGC
jgi:hypothetical protein